MWWLWGQPDHGNEQQATTRPEPSMQGRMELWFHAISSKLRRFHLNVKAKIGTCQIRQHCLSDFGEPVQTVASFPVLRWQKWQKWWCRPAARAQRLQEFWCVVFRDGILHSLVVTTVWPVSSTLSHQQGTGNFSFWTILCNAKIIGIHVCMDVTVTLWRTPP